MMMFIIINIIVKKERMMMTIETMIKEMTIIKIERNIANIDRMRLS